MSRYLVLVFFCLLAASPAFGQRKAGLKEFAPAAESKPETPEDIKEARRRAAGVRDLKSFGASREPPPKPFPWVGLGLAALLLGVAAPFGWKMYRSTRRELEDQSTFGLGKGRSEKEGKGDASRAGSRPPSRAKAKGRDETKVTPVGEVSGRDAVWDAIGTSNGSWVTADWVASATRLPIDHVTDEIGALVEEGYLQEARNSSGKPVFRAAAS